MCLLWTQAQAVAEGRLKYLKPRVGALGSEAESDSKVRTSTSVITSHSDKPVRLNPEIKRCRQKPHANSLCESSASCV